MAHNLKLSFSINLLSYSLHALSVCRTVFSYMEGQESVQELLEHLHNKHKIFLMIDGVSFSDCLYKLNEIATIFMNC